MSQTADAPRSSLTGVVEGSAVVAAVLIALRISGLAPLASYLVALAAGTAVTVVLCRQRGGPQPAVGMAIVLTVAYSMLVGVLAVFALAVVGVD
ncbi:hypothetical protein DSM112329_05056 [Paraconexibacter sp. AEG42_29]|uniref:DUF4190 domain-containing protein n=1 Tax=Paraconexibacter sp. AEG42_29 TaxID=2997339 RepID=A0AAU7B2K8_9ACTN